MIQPTVDRHNRATLGGEPEVEINFEWVESNRETLIQPRSGLMMFLDDDPGWPLRFNPGLNFGILLGLTNYCGEAERSR